MGLPSGISKHHAPLLRLGTEFGRSSHRSADIDAAKVRSLFLSEQQLTRRPKFKMSLVLTSCHHSIATPQTRRGKSSQFFFSLAPAIQPSYPKCTSTPSGILFSSPPSSCLFSSLHHLVLVVPVTCSRHPHQAPPYCSVFAADQSTSSFRMPLA